MITDAKRVEGPGWHIHYTVHGEGPPLVMLHGGGPGASGASNYSRNIEALSRRFRCYVIDFPGWGRSSKNLDQFGAAGPFQNGGRALLAFMDAVGLDRAHLMGNSFGANAALSLALEHPKRVDRIVMMGPGGGVVPGTTGPTPGIVQLLSYYTGEGPTLEKMQAFLQHLVFDTSVLTDELVKQRFDASNDAEITANPPLKLPPSGPRPNSILMSQDPRLKELAHRTLIVWGLQDRVNPVDGMAGFRSIPNADFVLLANCGHWAQWEQAEKFNDFATAFLLDWQH